MAVGVVGIEVDVKVTIGESTAQCYAIVAVGVIEKRVDSEIYIQSGRFLEEVETFALHRTAGSEKVEF